MSGCELLAAAARCLSAADPDAKVRLTHETAARIRAGALRRAADIAWTPAAAPGRPTRPELVAPRDLPKRGLDVPEGRAALVHAVAHIEFNAINLAWDAVQRFPAMPAAFALDWARVADDEARHFAMLRQRLRELGYDYGDFPAHDGLWQMAEATAGDALARMALVPRVLEARGLDVTPGMIARLERVGDEATAACLQVILREEVEHVAIGSRWFRWLCEQRGLP
ncbi:MAG: ferritin-like domain-containing protein, partial [Thiohalocapsa sp.]